MRSGDLRFADAKSLFCLCHFSRFSRLFRVFQPQYDVLHIFIRKPSKISSHFLIHSQLDYSDAFSDVVSMMNSLQLTYEQEGPHPPTCGNTQTDLSKLVEEKQRTCCEENMKAIVNSQMVCSFTVAMHASRVGGKLRLNAPPSYVVRRGRGRESDEGRSERREGGKGSGVC